MPLLKPICGQFLSQLSPPVIVRQQPGQNLIHLLNSVLQLWKAVFVIPCRNINGRQIMEKILSFFRTAQIRNQKAEFLLVQFIFDIFNGFIVERDYTDAFAHDGRQIRQNIQYGLGFSRAGRPFYYGYGMRKGFFHGGFLAQVKAKRENDLFQRRFCLVYWTPVSNKRRARFPDE